MAGGRARVAVSILDADHSNMAYAIRRARAEGADRFHIDVMDGHFVPNLTFGPRMIKGIRPRTELPLDAHLMISDPLQVRRRVPRRRLRLDHVPRRGRPGADRAGARGRSGRPAGPPGLAVKPKTPLTALEPYRKLLDIVLVMTVEPGLRRPGVHARRRPGEDPGRPRVPEPQAGRRPRSTSTAGSTARRPSSSAGSGSTSSSSARCSGSRAATWVARSASSGRSPTRATSTA